MTVPDAGSVRTDVLGRAAERKGRRLPGDGLWERGSEVTTLRAAFDAAASGTGQLVLVEGPAGIGKSRLLAVARSLATERRLP
jgi:predicted ATPase